MEAADDYYLGPGGEGCRKWQICGFHRDFKVKCFMVLAGVLAHAKMDHTSLLPP